MKYDTERARAAVQYLVDTPYYPHRVKGLRTEVQRPRALPYKGEEEVLNELLVIGRQNLQAMENLIAVAEYKRNRTRGDYQRQYMADSRRRHRLAVQLEERRTGRKMDLDERVNFGQEIQDIWMSERDVYLAKRRDAFFIQFKEEPTHEDTRNFIAQFWEQKEKELQFMLNEPPSKEHNLRNTRIKMVATATNTAIAAAFQKVVAKHKK